MHFIWICDRGHGLAHPGRLLHVHSSSSYLGSRREYFFAPCILQIGSRLLLIERDSSIPLHSGMEAYESKFKTICVFCGSSSGNKRSYSQAASDLGKELIRRKIDLVYGGGNVGLMGLVAETVFEGGCRVRGVIPKALMPHEISGKTVGEVTVVADMHQRKAEMAREADAFIALPGGYGTLEELLEMITWSQLGIHDKPVGLLNVDGYYNALLSLFDKGAEEGFIKAKSRQIVLSASTSKELIDLLEAYIPAHERVAPKHTWDVEHLGYSAVPHNIQLFQSPDYCMNNGMVSCLLMTK